MMIYNPNHRQLFWLSTSTSPIHLLYILINSKQGAFNADSFGLGRTDDVDVISPALF